MPCYNPITAYKSENGDIVFAERQRHGTTQNIQIACGQCIGCRLNRSRAWAMRCVHEAALYQRSCFITLTYDDENKPHRGQLTYEHFQKFMKRLRKKQDNIRFYMGGEYGTQYERPHYHAILFNWDWTDKQYFKTTGSGEKIYTSKELEQLWTYGYSSTADMTFNSAAYIARYCIQKVTGDAAEEHYKRTDEEGEYQLIPEFNQMSRKPGIGAEWLRIFKQDVYTSDLVIINGIETNVPKYYDKLHKRQDPESMQRFKDEREWNGYQHRNDNTTERLKVKETVTQAKLKQLYRGQI